MHSTKHCEVFFGLFVSYLLQLLLNPNDPMEDGFILSDFFFFDLKTNTTSPNIYIIYIYIYFFFIEYKFDKFIIRLYFVIQYTDKSMWCNKLWSHFFTFKSIYKLHKLKVSWSFHFGISFETLATSLAHLLLSIVRLSCGQITHFFQHQRYFYFCFPSSLFVKLVYTIAFCSWESS